MTPEAVNAALDEVRPYLIADGGNVEVASVEDGTVYLRLQVCSSFLGQDRRVLLCMWRVFP